MSYSFQLDPTRDPNSFAPVPGGDYDVVAVKAEWRSPKPEAESQNEYLYVEFDIVDSEYAGRKLWWRCHLQHDSERTQSIALNQMTAFCFSSGLKGWNDPEELVGLRATATVTVREAQKGFPASNDIRTFTYDDEAPARAASGTATAQRVTIEQATKQVQGKPAATQPTEKKGWA